MTVAALMAGLAAMLLAVGAAELIATVERRRRPPGAALVAALARLGRRVGVPSAPRDLQARLQAAGEPFGLGPRDLMAVKVGCALVAFALALPLGATLPGRLPVLAAIGLPVGAFVAPERWLARRARRRGERMEVELPDALDLLRVALDAGLSIDRALAEVARRDRGLLAGEWRTAAAMIELGIPRDQALATMRRRCPAPGIAPLIAALQRSSRHGSPLGEALAALATEARATRARRIREQAARAAPKIQLAVALLLVPSVLLLVVAAMVAGIGR